MPYDLPTPDNNTLFQLTEIDTIVLKQIQEQQVPVNPSLSENMPTVITFIKNFATIIQDHWESLIADRVSMTKISLEKMQKIKQNVLIALLVSQSYLLEKEQSDGVVFAAPFNQDESNIVRLSILHILLPHATSSEIKNFFITQKFEDAQIKSYLKFFQRILANMATKIHFSTEQIAVFQAIEDRLLQYQLITERQHYKITPITAITPASESSAITDSGNNPLDNETTPAEDKSTIAASHTFDPLPLDYLVQQVTAFHARYENNRAILDSQRYGALLRAKTITSRPQDILSIIYTGQLVNHLATQNSLSSETLRKSLLAVLLETIISIKAEYDAAWTPRILSILITNTPTDSATYCSAAQILLAQANDSQTFDPASLLALHTISIPQRIQYLTQLHTLLMLPDLDPSSIIKGISKFGAHEPKDIIAQTRLNVEKRIAELQKQIPVTANEADIAAQQTPCAM